MASIPTRKLLERHINAAVRHGLRISASVRKALLDLVDRVPLERLAVEIARLLRRTEAERAESIRLAILGGWLIAGRDILRDMPEKPPKIAPDARSPLGAGDSTFPQLELAHADLMTRRIVTPDEFARITKKAKDSAFTVAGQMTEQSIAAVRDRIAENVREGGTLRDFQGFMASLPDNVLSPAQVEAVYRTQTGAAYSAGQRAILDHPLISGEFPYLLWTATHDSRVRPEHLAMEKHGQNGSAVYRRDDPIWDTLYPPAGWNCRCMVIPLTVEDAAFHGSKEAKRWKISGNPPDNPEYAKQPYPIEIPPGWPTHNGIEAL